MAPGPCVAGCFGSFLPLAPLGGSDSYKFVAVFRAYRELEVVVRELGGFGAEDIGARLMRSAFKAGTGPLADRGIPEGEQESIAHLFAGAVGRFKNPHSHRHHIIADANAAYRILVICSQLMYEAEAGANDGDR